MLSGKLPTWNSQNGLKGRVHKGRKQPRHIWGSEAHGLERQRVLEYLMWKAWLPMEPWEDPLTSVKGEMKACSHDQWHLAGFLTRNLPQ